MNGWELQAATGSSPSRADLFAPHLTAACAAYEITGPARLPAFLAQLAHESGSLRYVREIADGSAYEGRRDLGNVKPGDGPRYRGRGLIQVTGRDNYRAMARELQPHDAPDFEDFPEALEEPKWAAWSAAAWWAIHGCNELADRGEYVAIGRLINRGNANSTRAANGEADRLARWERAKAALATASDTETQRSGGFSDTETRRPDSASAAPAEPESAPAPRITDTMPPGEAPDWTPPPPKESTMPLPAIIAALLPSFIEAIPKLGKVFGSGSAVAERNLKAAELVTSTVTAALGAANEQDAVAKLKADPAAVAVAAKAVDAIWFELTEAGGGGVDGARKADAAAQAGGDIMRSPSFWIGMLLLPLVYLLVLSLIGMVGTATWSDDVRAGLAGSLISAIVGGLVGYYFGQTTTRNRTPQ